MKFSYFLRLLLIGLIASFLFFIIDNIWLNALSVLNISYGPIILPLIVFTFVRIIFFLTGLIYQLGLSLKRVKPLIKFYTWSLLLPNLILLIFGLYGFYLEPIRVSVNKFELAVKDLEKPVRIVQLSDLHIEKITPRENAVITIVDELNPEIIVITGDFINLIGKDDSETIKDLRGFISDLHAPLGLYAINGNYESTRKLVTMLEGQDIQVLDNEVKKIYLPDVELTFLGVTFEEWFGDEDSFLNLVESVNPDEYLVLLYHTPNLVYLASDMGIDLYLTGHTHCGQVRLPFYGAIITNTKYGKKFDMGVYNIGEMTMNVNCGLGFASGIAPRIRFLAPPEVTVIDLVPEK
jgi:predicted MPP superfamily phosphohydrolase